MVNSELKTPIFGSLFTIYFAVTPTPNFNKTQLSDHYSPKIGSLITPKTQFTFSQFTKKPHSADYSSLSIVMQKH